MIGHLNGEWERSVRREVLLSLVFGPMDWTGAAALVVLTDLAMHDEAIAREVMGVFAALLRSRPNEGAWALETPLMAGLARLPQVDAETRQFALSRLTG